MGLLDELKKLTKPYDDEDYLEEDLAEPLRAPGRAASASRCKEADRPEFLSGLVGNVTCGAPLAAVKVSVSV